MPLVFTLLLNFNCSEDTVVLYDQLVELKLDLKILVIDNNSTEYQKNILLKHITKNKIIFNSKNLGYAGGNNIGIKSALTNNADYVWILNPDIRIEENTLNTLLRTFKEQEKLAAVGPRIIQRENRDLIFSDGEILEFNERCSTNHKNHNVKAAEISPDINLNIDYIDGSSILLNALALKEIGSLCEDYFLYFEETDWCYRARARSWKLAVNSDSVVYNTTSIKNGLFHFYMIRNRLIFSKRYHPEFKNVRSFYIKAVLRELINRFRGNYFQPFFFNRFMGLISGLIKTI
jgi:GT2 family glycosyltransferase